MKTQTVVAGTPMSSPTKQFLESSSFSEAQAVGEVTAMLTDIDNAQSREPNKPKNAAQTSTIAEIDVDSMTSSASEELAASGNHIPVDVLSSTENDENSEEHPDFEKRTVLVEGKLHKFKSKFRYLLSVEFVINQSTINFKSGQSVLAIDDSQPYC